MGRLLTIRGHARWGYLRLKGELRKLGFEVSASTIRRVLRQHRIPPAPRRSALTWRRFLAAHASTIVATDFLADTVFLKRFYVLHLESGRILSQTVDGDVAFLTYERIRDA